MYLKKSLSVVLAVIMAFGALPFITGALLVSAFESTDRLTAIHIELADETLNKDALTLEVGNSAELSVTASTSNAQGDSKTTVSLFDVSWAYSVDEKVKIEDNRLVAVSATDTPVTVTAIYTLNGTTKTDTMTVTVTSKASDETKLEWNWTGDSSEHFMPGQTISFDKKYTITSADESAKDVVLTCDVPEALEIDNVKKTFTVNPIEDSEVSVTLTLTIVNGEEEPSAPVIATKKVKIHREIPLSKVNWDYDLNPEGKVGFNFYSTKTGIPLPAEYYFKKEDGEQTTYKYSTVPSYAREFCTVKATSADERVMQVDAKTNRLIPVGNGESMITLTLTTPNGKRVYSARMIACVAKSPYTPITHAHLKVVDFSSGVGIASDKKTVTARYRDKIVVEPVLNDGAKLNHDVLTCSYHDGREDSVIATKATAVWQSSNPNVAKVDDKGNITCLMPGDVVISLVIQDNSSEPIVAPLSIKVSMNWWQALLAWLFGLFKPHI